MIEIITKPSAPPPRPPEIIRRSSILPSDQHRYRWFCLLGDHRGNVLLAPSGNPQLLVFELQAFADKELVIEHVQKHYCRSSDPRTKIIPLKAWAGPEDVGPLRQPPTAWFMFGHERMVQEIEAGLRPYSEVCLPPLEYLADAPTIVPTRDKGLKPTRRR